MTAGPRLLPLFLVALFLSALAGALASLAGPGAYLPRLLLLGAAISLLLFFYRGRREIVFLFVRVRHVAEPGPATTWLLAAGLLLIGSVVLEQEPVRFDTTKRGLNSLSDASLTVLSAGTEPVELIGIFRETHSQRERARDLMEVYRTASRRVRTEMLDPDRRPDRARELGLTRSGYILVRAGDVEEEVGELNERSLSQAILRAENPRRVQIAFTTGHGERETDDGGPEGLGKLASVLRGVGYKTTEVALLEEEIPGTAAVVAIVGPRRRFMPAEIEKLRAHLDGGGRMLVCLEPGFETGLEPTLEARAIILDSLEVSDDSPATRGLGFGPRVVVIADYRPHPIVESGMGYSVFPGARRIALRKEAVWGLSADVLFVTGPQARLVSPAEGIGASTSGNRGRMSLGIAQEWEVPGSDEPLPGEAAPEKPFGRLMVVGDSDWLSGSFLDLFSNRELATRSLHWLARREFLLRITPLDRQGTPLRVSLGGMRTLFYLLQVAIPLLLLGVGLWIWNRRR